MQITINKHMNCSKIILSQQDTILTKCSNLHIVKMENWNDLNRHYSETQLTLQSIITHPTHMGLVLNILENDKCFKDSLYSPSRHSRYISADSPHSTSSNIFLHFTFQNCCHFPQHNYIRMFTHHYTAFIQHHYN